MSAQIIMINKNVSLLVQSLRKKITNDVTQQYPDFILLLEATESGRETACSNLRIKKITLFSPSQETLEWISISSFQLKIVDDLQSFISITRNNITLFFFRNALSKKGAFGWTNF